MRSFTSPMVGPNLARILTVLIVSILSCLAWCQVGGGPGGGGGGSWQITSRWVGTVTTESGSVSMDVSAPSMGISSTSFVLVQGTTTFTVKWTGQDPPPNNVQYYLRITPSSAASARNGITSAYAEDALKSPSSITYPMPPPQVSHTLTGSTVEKISLNGQSEFTVTLSSTAVASSSNLSEGMVVASSGFGAEVIEKGLDSIISMPSPTYRRLPGGVGALNTPQNGFVRADIGMYVVESYPNSYLYAEYNTYSKTCNNGWQYPLQALNLSGNPNGMDTEYDEQDLSTGTLRTSTLGIFAESYGDNKAAIISKIAAMIENPFFANQVVTASDSNGSLSKYLHLYVHGPIEDTGETWAPFASNVQLFTEAPIKSIVGEEYQPAILGEMQYNGPTHASVNITISNSAKYHYGTRAGNNWSVETEIKAVKLHYGEEHEYDTSNDYEVNHSYSFETEISNGNIVTLYSVPKGNVTYPVLATYGVSGYTSDKGIAKVSNFHMMYLLEVKPN